MRTLKDNPSVGVFGEIWAQKTCDLIKTAKITDRVTVFNYTEREALFFDQDNFFIITDFGQSTGGWDSGRLQRLDQMRQVIATRSMKTVIFANDDDLDISTSLREACCRVIRIRNLNWNNIPISFSSLIVSELSKQKSSGFQHHHETPVFAEKQTTAA